MPPLVRAPAAGAALPARPRALCEPSSASPAAPVEARLCEGCASRRVTAEATQLQPMGCSLSTTSSIQTSLAGATLKLCQPIMASL